MQDYSPRDYSTLTLTSKSWGKYACIRIIGSRALCYPPQIQQQLQQQVFKIHVPREVKNIILVLSGKGGVGKSSVAAHFALTLRDLNYKVGILDIDLCGPSIPYLLNVEGKDVHQSSEGWMPVFTDQSQTLAVMSIGFLLTSRNDAVAWRGPKKNAMIKQFISDVQWKDLDFLVVDMPPGTSDEHITLVESLKEKSNVGAVLVTTPQMVAIDDVRREISFCKTASLPVLGIIENMSGFVCPNCKECSAVFSQGGGESLAQESNITFLGSLPIDPTFAASTRDRSLKAEISTTESLDKFNMISQIIVNKLNDK